MVLSKDNLNNPIVSVCVQTYQHASYIRDALDGILMQQTDFDFEIVLGEDESTDGTREICIDYAKQYHEKIRLFLNSRKNVIYINGHPTGRWNILNNLKNARGKYIALLPGDDYWTDPLKLQKQVAFLEANPDYAISFHNAVVEFDDPNKKAMPYSNFSWNKIEPSRDIYSIHDLIASPLCPTASVVFRHPKHFIIPDWFYKVPSGDMALEMLICGDFKIKYFDETWAAYRKHSGGVTAHHKGEYIHAGRIYMYLRILEHYGARYADSITKVILSHLHQLKDFSSLSDDDQRKVSTLIPNCCMIKRKKFKLNAINKLKVFLLRTCRTR